MTHYGNETPDFQQSSGNFFDKMHSAQSFKKSSESKSKVRANYELKALFSNIALDKKEPSFAPLLALFKAVELSCVTCGGAHSHQNCPATHGNVYRANISEVRDTPCEVQIPEVNKGPRAPCLFLAHKVQHPSNLSVGGDNEKSRNQANEQIDKFYEIFKEMSFEISFTDALVLMPKFASTLRTLLGNKEKLTEVLRTWMDECLALADLGASINLMPFSVWEKLSLPDLTPTCMTLELADRSISKPMGIAKDISVKVGVFPLSTDFVVLSEVDLDPTPSPFNSQEIDVIDMACEEYSQEVLGFTDVIASGNSTPYDDPIVATSSPTLTPFGIVYFLLLEEARLFPC
ncbi:reverse transcriptase domain-containing protein [Tanacetum coccineum]|uniref:Reverse transcriptase domain-containing protein n=1 Tax=Tanacetum coccineum TaxID=301880 RepID=A0ABQ5E166_9ASTR